MSGLQLYNTNDLSAEKCRTDVWTQPGIKEKSLVLLTRLRGSF